MVLCVDGLVVWCCDVIYVIVLRGIVLYCVVLCYVGLFVDAISMDRCIDVGVDVVWYVLMYVGVSCCVWVALLCVLWCMLMLCVVLWHGSLYCGMCDGVLLYVVFCYEISCCMRMHVIM